MALQLEEEVQEIEVTRHSITLEEYDRMVEAEIFEEHARIELIEGEILDMAAIKFPHQSAVARLTRLLTIALGDKAYIWPQGNDIPLLGTSRPQPDLTVLKWRDDLYSVGGPHVTSDAVLLVVEVSESSLRYDRGRKLSLYARAGLPEYWIVNLKEGVIEVYSEPAEGKYRSVRVARRGDTLQLPGGLEGSVAVEDVLGAK